MVAKAIMTLIAAGKGFQLVGRLMRSGKTTEAKQVIKHLKGADKKKAEVEFKAAERRMKEGAHSGKAIDKKDVAAQGIGKTKKLSQKEKSLLELKPQPRAKTTGQKNISIEYGVKPEMGSKAKIQAVKRIIEKKASSPQEIAKKGRAKEYLEAHAPKAPKKKKPSLLKEKNKRVMDTFYGEGQ